MKSLQQVFEGLFDVEGNTDDVTSKMPVEFAQYFSVIWNKYNDGDNVSLKEGQNIFDDFKKLVQNLTPQTKKYNFIQRLLRRKNPVMYMSTGTSDFVDYYQHGFAICVDLPNRKHWEISFTFPWTGGTPEAPVFDRTRYEFNKMRHDQWRGPDEVENNDYIVRIIPDEAVNKIKELK